MSAPAPTIRERLAALFMRIEAFFAATSAREAPAITCHAGCDDCCRRRFTVTGLEAAVIREGLAALSEPRRLALAARADEGLRDVCPALDDDGRCAIYDHRPVICRTHGLPIRFTEARGGRSLPLLDACPKNFVGRDLGALDPASVLDQATLSTILGALDAADADATGRARGERVAIAELLSAR